MGKPLLKWQKNKGKTWIFSTITFKNPPANSKKKSLAFRKTHVHCECHKFNNLVRWFFFFWQDRQLIEYKNNKLKLGEVNCLHIEYESYEAFFVSNMFKETETDIQPLPQKIKIQRFIIEPVDYYTTFWLNIYSAKTKTK